MLASLKLLIKKITTLILLPSVSLLLAGCDLTLFDSKGYIGVEIADTMIYTVLLMLIVVIPTIFLSVYIPYKYRAKNDKTKYEPEWSHSTIIEAICWGVPIVIILFLAVETYKTSHALDPHKEIVSVKNPDVKPLKIQVVALDWKWLFIYPEQGIATVNEIAVPVDQPVQFLITSDGAINSFFIPRLGGQIYAMSGMESKINLMANEAGVYKGISANYSGSGFTNMRFKVRAVDDAGFDSWVQKAKSSGNVLDDATYQTLATTERKEKHDGGGRALKPYPVTYYVNKQPLRFKNIIDDNTGLNEAKARLAEKKKAHEESAKGSEEKAEH